MTEAIKGGKGINLNNARVDDLEHIGGMGRQRAQKLIEYRNEHGPFKSWEDVKAVPGFTKLADELKNQGVQVK